MPPEIRSRSLGKSCRFSAAGFFEIVGPGEKRMRLKRGVVLCLSVSTFVAAMSSSASAMGKRPTQSPGALPSQHSVSGFNMTDDGLYFPNYAVWSGSHLIPSTQLYHCAGMALMTRQVFNFGKFNSAASRVSWAEYRARLTKIFNVSTETLPDSIARVELPGFANLYEMSREPEIEAIIKDLLGDAFNDIFRPNWNWSVFDLFGSTVQSRQLIEQNLRRAVSRDRASILYLTDGFKSAHAILLYAYEDRGDEIWYTAVDSNHPDGAYQLRFIVSQGKFDHPDFGLRDPWILHPYADQF